MSPEPSSRRRNRARRRARGLRLRDRFFQPAVARAITSPSGLVAGSVAAGTLIASGAHPAVCFLAGLVFWAFPVGRAMRDVPGFRKSAAPAKARPKRTEDDVFWEAAVADAERAEEQFVEAIEGCRSGPLLDRLKELEEDVVQSVDRCHEVARIGAEASTARRELDPAAMERVARRAGRAAKDAAASQRKLIAELLDLEADSRAKLTLLNGRLDEAVGRAVELAGRAARLGDEDDATRVAADLASELAQLSEALHEIDQHEHPHVLRGRRRAAETRPSTQPGTTATG